MKKFLSIVAVLALIFALTVPAMAAPLSVTAAEDSTTAEVVTEGGEALTVEVAAADMTPAEEEALPAAVEEAAENASAVEVVDVELKDAEGNVVSEEYFDGTNTLTVAFVREDTTKEVVAVLYWDEANSKWDEAPFEIKDGKILAEFSHLCTVAFVLKGVENNAPVAGDNKPAAPEKKDPSKSPQTGYNTALWIAAAVVLLLGAGYCFVSARKKAAE